MARARHSAVIAASIAVLWARLSDLEGWPRWLRVPYASEAVSITSSPPAAVGTEFSLKGRLAYRLFARISRWEEGRCLAFEIHRSQYPSDRLFFKRAVIAIELEGLDEGRTRVTCTHRAEGKGPWGGLYMAVVMRPFLSANVHWITDSLGQAV